VQSPDSQRGALGSVYRLTAEFLAKRGVMDKVKAQASEPTRTILEKPPFAFAWRGYEPLEEIERILYVMPGGPQLCVDLGHAAGSQLSGSVIEPVLRMAMSLFGKTPATMFANLDRFFSMVVRGFTFSYEAGSAKDGVVLVEIAGGQVHLSLFEQLRGNLRTIFDLCAVKGSIAAAEVVRRDDKGAQIRIPVRWE
jgi:hypothetical protein